jgi:hypothetical protein
MLAQSQARLGPEKRQYGLGTPKKENSSTL